MLRRWLAFAAATLLAASMLTPWAGPAAALFSSAFFLGGETRLETLDYSAEPYHVRFEDVRMRWGLAPGDGNRFTASSLRAARIVISRRGAGGAGAPAALPERISLPFPIRVEHGAVGEILWQADDASYSIRDVQFRFSGDDARLALTLTRAATPWGTLALDLALDNRRPYGLAGQIALEQPQAATPYQLQARLAGSLQHLQASASIDLVADAGSVRLQSAPHPQPGGRLEIHAELHPFDGQRFTAHGRLLQLDPHLLHASAAGLLNLDWRLQGSLAPVPEAHVELDMHNSRLRDQPVSGRLNFSLTPGRLHAVSGELHHDGGRLQLAGALGAAGDQLAWQWQADRLDWLQAEWAGRLDLQGTLAGSLRTPDVTLQLRGDALQFGQALQVDNLRGKATLAAGDDAPLLLELHLADARLAGLPMAAGSLNVTGTRGTHAAQFTLSGEEIDFEAALQGGLHAWSDWRGRLVSLNNRGRPDVALEAPAPLRLAADGLALQDAILDFAGGRLAIHDARIGMGGLSLRGEARDIPMAALPGTISASSDLTVSAAWNLQGDETLNGTLSIWRSRGDLVVAGQALELRQARLEVRVDAGVLHLEGEFAGGRAGELRAQGSTRISRRNGRFGIAGDAPLDFTASASLPSIAWLTALQLPPALAMDGRLQVQVRAAGTVAAPQLSGRADGSALHISWPEQGLELEDGVLVATFAGDRLAFERLRWQTGDGHFDATGWLRWSDHAPSLELRARAQRFALLARADHYLTVSGDGNLRFAEGRLDLAGSVTADEGLIELPPQDRPALGEDVVVLDGAPRPPERGTLRVGNLTLALDLGRNFRLRGRGLDSQLAGALQLRREGDVPLHASGSIQVTRGTYLAYGQPLQIERGILNFSGPLDNPGINVRAMRSSQPVKAGIELTGTAQQPVARLVSEPDVPDSEKLSWLVLGHGLESAGRDQFAMLSLAAGALLSGSQSVPLQTRFAHAVGLDEFGISGGGEGTDTVVSFGKRLSDRARISYERGITNMQNAVRLTYDISSRWSLRLQGGTDNAADLFYTFSFD